MNKDILLEELNQKLKSVGNNAEQREAVLMEWANKHITVNKKRVKIIPNDPGAGSAWKICPEEHPNK